MSCRFLESSTLIMFNVTYNIMQCSNIHIYMCVVSCLWGASQKPAHISCKQAFCVSVVFVSLHRFHFSFFVLVTVFSLYLSLIVCFPFHSTLWMRAFRTQMPIYICYSFDSVLVFVFLQRAWNWTIFKQFVLICINSCDHTVGIAIAVYQPTHLAELIWSYIYAHIFTYISGISWSRLFVLLLSHCAAYKHNF